MATRRRHFFTALAERAIPGAGRLISAVDSLDGRIENLEKKLDGVEGAVDKRLSQIDHGIERLSKSMRTERRGDASRVASERPDSDRPGDAETRA
jgi:hypothetical protein